MINILAFFHSVVFWVALFTLMPLLAIYPTTFFIRLISRILLIIGLVKVKVAGLENIPRQHQGLILAANHPGFIDFLVHYKVFPIKFRFVVAYTFFLVPIIRRFVKKMNYIPVGEKKGRKLVMKGTAVAIISAMKNKEVLFVFPEGQRKKEPGQVMARFRDWTARIAQATGAPVIPIGVRGSEKILPKMRFIMYPGTVEVVIGKPIYLTKDMSANEATQKLEREIMALYKASASFS